MAFGKKIKDMIIEEARNNANVIIHEALVNDVKTSREEERIRATLPGEEGC